MLIKNQVLLEKKTDAYEERDEEQRSEFIKKLEKVEQAKLVYVDEAGFDNREDYPYGYSPRGERCYGLKSPKEKRKNQLDCSLKIWKNLCSFNV